MTIEGIKSFINDLRTNRQEIALFEIAYQLAVQNEQLKLSHEIAVKAISVQLEALEISKRGQKEADEHLRALFGPLDHRIPTLPSGATATEQRSYDGVPRDAEGKPLLEEDKGR